MRLSGSQNDELWARMVARGVLLVLVTVAVAWGLFFYFHLDRDTSTPYDSAFADYMRDRTRGLNISSGEELAKITSACGSKTHRSQ
jgi:hypothetical protein